MLSQSATIMDIIFRNFATFQKSLDSPQVKQRLISSIKSIVYELPHQLPNDLRLRILSNQEISGKLQNYQEKIVWRQSLVPSLPSRNKSFVIAIKNHPEAEMQILCSCPFLFDFFTFSKYFVQDCRLVSICFFPTQNLI